MLGSLPMADGARIRTLLLPADQPIANLLVLNGRADFLEKWADAYGLLHASGFSVFSFDWRGQGGSTRLHDSGAGHIDSFESWMTDLDALAAHAQASLAPAPWLALGHSMGGHLLTRWLADPAHARHPLRAEVRGAMLVAPFFGFALPWAVRQALVRTARLKVAAGQGAQFVWGQKPYGAHQQRLSRQHLLTGSRPHFEDEGRWVGARPELATGGVSWGWVKAFVDSEDHLEALPLETMALPALMLLASRERLVDNRRAMRIAARLPACERHMVAGAAHELLRERDGTRQLVLSKLKDFAAKVLA